MKYDTTFINRNFLLKVYGVDSENKRINRLVGVSGLVGLNGKGNSFKTNLYD